MKYIFNAVWNFVKINIFTVHSIWEVIKMRKSFKELISEYFITQLTERENEVNELQKNVRFRKVEVTDSYELQYALVRHETTKQISKDIFALMLIEDNVIK